MNKSVQILLKPFGRLYAAAMNARRKFYEKKIFKSYDLDAKTIAVGNITVGGTGKTPTVAFVARVLAEHGEKVCVLTRGYGRPDAHRRVVVADGENILSDPREAGDEPFELALKLRGISAVIADADRRAAGEFARKNFGTTAFVLDDAFQHLRVRRDLDIVLIDATNPFGNSEVLPAGILREDLTNLGRADVIVVTRANLVGNIEELKNKLQNAAPQAKIFVSENKIAKIVSLKDFFANSLDKKESNTPEFFKNRKAAAFCALGNPQNFFAQLGGEGIDPAATKIFRDHHVYTQNDVDEIETETARKGAEILLTTAKDAVKLENLRFTMPCVVVEIEQKFDDEPGLRKLILELPNKR